MPEAAVGSGRQRYAAPNGPACGWRGCMSRAWLMAVGCIKPACNGALDLASDVPAAPLAPSVPSSHHTRSPQRLPSRPNVGNLLALRPSAVQLAAAFDTTVPSYERAACHQQGAIPK
ncbi:hypothetical protein M8818_003057 [Zalaria obscura]|uniref:Uncharacterized protein n=1 Tax=Zalaria obscura TaxID=2024903 RepID=A0ACC3SGU9_9PEZI